MSFEQLLVKRRSIYNLGDNLTPNSLKIEKILQTALKYCPSAFNSQSGRIILLQQNAHLKFWKITANKLQTTITPQQFIKTKQKIESFAAAKGTILFFDDSNITIELQKRFPLYKESFPIWSEQSQGMLQFIVWTLLAEQNIGASLQHYNPLIDNEIQKEFNYPSSWQLQAQMPFGNIISPPENKDFLSIDKRLKIFSN